MNRVVQLVAAGGVVFNPYLNIRRSISSASDAIEEQFNAIDTAFSAGTSVKQAVKQGKRIRKIMQQVITSARVSGFSFSQDFSRKKTPALYGRQVMKEAATRADLVAGLMRHTTRVGLKRNPDSDFILSRERAVAAVKFEAARAYYAGIKDGFQDTEYLKEWITSAEGDICEECQANEEDGPIGVGEVFSSGDEFPAAHLNCVLGDCDVTASGITSATSSVAHRELITFATGSDGNLTVTANHPILTQRGWVLAKDVKQGDYLVSFKSDAFVSLLYPDNDKVKASAQDIFNSFVVAQGVSTTTMPAAAKDLDNGVAAHKINNVRTYGDLSSVRKSAIIKGLGKEPFVLAWANNFASSNRLSAFLRVRALPASNCFVRFLRAALAFAWITVLSKSQTKFSNDGVTQSPMADLVLISNFLKRFFRSCVDFVKLTCFSNGHRLFSCLFESYVAAAQLHDESIVTDFQDFGSFHHRIAFGIQLERILNKSVVLRTCRTFNYGTKSHTYLASGYIVHNCDCYIVMTRRK